VPQLLAALTLAASFTVLGPGALAPADAGVLENAQALRLRYGWGLEREAPTWATLAAVEDCSYLGYSGYAVVEGLGLVPLVVVDCQRLDEEPRLHDLGIVADVSDARLGHKRAWLLIWRTETSPPGNSTSL
jgi:hypothetical protein